jgi:hypothetical protein
LEAANVQDSTVSQHNILQRQCIPLLPYKQQQGTSVVEITSSSVSWVEG